MTRFTPLASAAALIFALAGCGTEPAQQSDVASEQGEVAAGEPPAMVETMPVADKRPTASAPAATEEVVPPEKSRPKQEPAAKAAMPPQAKTAPEAPKPVEPEPDPHAGHDMDKK